MGRAFLVSCLALCAACPPTLSRPDSPEFDRRLAEAERDAHHGRDAEAAAAFGEAAELADRRVDRDEARYRQARALGDLERYDEALVVLDAIAATRPPSRRTPRAVFDAARIRTEHGLGDGEEGFLRVIREFPESGLASRALHWLLRAHEPEAALAQLRMLDDIAGETSLGDDILMRMHDVHIALDDGPSARQALERLVERHPYPHGERWDEAILLLAEMDVEAGRPDDAVRRLETMLERAEATYLSGSYTLPGFPKAHLRIAQIHRDEGRRADADRWYRTLEDRFETSTLRDDAAVQRAFMWLDAGDTERGCELIAEALEAFEVGHPRRLASERSAAECPGPNP